TVNALAAGYSPFEASVMVTAGALEKLDRDELQGVLAHEFSHIVNGDMRINIRLVGVLAGISGIGRWLRHDANLLEGEEVRDKDDANWVGILVSIFQWPAFLTARVIRMAISRQREYLADAAAVQFT